MSSLDLQAALLEFQQVCLVALDDTPAGRPPCTYISPGPPPWDVEDCLVVWTTGPALADTSPTTPSLSPGHRAQAYGEVNLIGITATILRCSYVLDDTNPGGSIDPEKITAVAAQTNADIWAVWNHVRAAKRAGTLFAPTDREFVFDPSVALNQEGGAAGWQINVRTSLDGYAAPD